ncbi:MAG: manganese efflux pump [Lachnospiraceae bacterium]|nr:manganese efflux pump [Lachnospiraceae bacterium]
MNIWECLLIVIGLSLNVFLVSEYEGTMLKQVNMKKLLGVCGIFFLWQIASISAGYLITLVPFFQRSASADLKKMCYVIAAIILLIIAGYMLRRAWMREVIVERQAEIKFKRICLEAAVIAFFTFIAGIGCGFLGVRMIRICGILACATVLAVISGIYLGYHQGCLGRKQLYGVGGIIFLIVGVDIFVRCL